MGRTRNRILGTLRLRRLQARLALADVFSPRPDEPLTPVPVPVRVDEPRLRR